MGQCLAAGWSEKQFWKSSYRAVYNLIHTVHKKEEAHIKLTWEQVRTLCDFVVAPYRKLGQTGRSFVLPWDNEPGQPLEETPEEIENRNRIFDKLDRLMQKKYATQ